MTVHIRPFAAGDYAAMAAVGNAAYTDATGQALAAFHASDMREHDATRPAHCRSARWVAEEDGQVRGVGEYDQVAHRYHPEKFWVDVYVDPRYQGQGIGAALYAQVLAGLTPLDPLSARGNVREDQARVVAFFAQRGWREAMRTWESFLDVASLDLATYPDMEARTRAAEIAITTLPALAGDPARDRKLYDLVWEIRQDLPDLDAPTRESFADFTGRRLGNPHLLPDAFFVALDGDTYAGYIYHTSDPDDPRLLHIDQLGVARAYRGRGIAHALKVRSVAYAQAHGYRAMRTTNESQNRAVLTINERMGFVKRPAWLDLVKVFRA